MENIHGPVLLLSGKDDQIEPSSLMATRLMERLRRHGHPYGDEHLSCDGIDTQRVPSNGGGAAKDEADDWGHTRRYSSGAGG